MQRSDEASVTSLQCQSMQMTYSHKHMNTLLQSSHMQLIFQNKNQIKLFMFAAAHALPVKSPNVKVYICFP